MTSAEFAAWVKARGLSSRRAAKKLGVCHETVLKMLHGGNVGRQTAIICALLDRESATPQDSPAAHA